MTYLAGIGLAVVLFITVPVTASVLSELSASARSIEDRGPERASPAYASVTETGMPDVGSSVRAGSLPGVAGSMHATAEPAGVVGSLPLSRSADDPARTTNPASAGSYQTPARSIAIPRGSPVTLVRDAADPELAIVDAAREFGADPQQLLRVARCESRLDPDAAGVAGEIGIFQFKARTFKANAARLGYQLRHITDVVAQARVAAEMFTRDQAWQWSCK